MKQNKIDKILLHVWQQGFEAKVFDSKLKPMLETRKQALYEAIVECLPEERKCQYIMHDRVCTNVVVKAVNGSLSEIRKYIDELFGK